MKKTFTQIVVAKFKFLVRDYGFKIQSSVESPRNYFWEGEVVYTTETTYIYIECTRGENPSFNLGRMKDIDLISGNRTKYLLPFQIIYEYMVTTDAEKQIITSLTQHAQAGNIIYQEKYIGHEVPSVDNPEKQRELELETYARLMRKYAEPILLGDFSHWSEIWGYLTQKSIAGWIRPERSEFPRFAAVDKTGRQKVYGKQQYEENPRDYIEQLEKNVYSDNLNYIKQLKAELTT